jgi:hypothetical protein
MHENLNTKDLPLEAMRENRLSCKFTAGGNVWISSILKIYRQRQFVKTSRW